MRVVGSLRVVDRVFLSIDVIDLINDPLIGICKSLKYLIDEAKATGKYDRIIFTKGGDRMASNIPEFQLLQDEGVQIVD